MSCSFHFEDGFDLTSRTSFLGMSLHPRILSVQIKLGVLFYLKTEVAGIKQTLLEVSRALKGTVIKLGAAFFMNEGEPWWWKVFFIIFFFSEVVIVF